jgi:pheromone shutdown protein TraB
MLAAIEAGRKVGARLVLIDASIYQIIARIRAIPLSRKLSMLLRLFAGLLFTRAVTDLKEIPSERLIRQVLRHMRSAMPDFYKILVADRNAYMGRWIARLAREHGSVVAVVGAGHVPGLKRILKRKGLIK